ncbi:MAG TPA: bifunctional hydroxymethylpyrimidine kinase/phosphomethylpyrimidine kinase [Pelobium sp.]|nr:bifunctional hydroxymethylpyrimidine kinase/phosphomethylpyrimidine kinase [Pelobium sp.]
MQKPKYLPVLTIAGSDSGGGAGIQADIKTFEALGCFGASAITAITAQNTLGIFAIHSIPASTVKAQIVSVMDDIKPLAIKIGMLYHANTVKCVAETLKKYPLIPIIFDPVITASSGDNLNQGEVLSAFKEYLFPIVDLLTPNLSEASQLLNRKVETLADMEDAAKLLIRDTQLKSVLVKGGHLVGNDLVNFYLHQNGYSQAFKYKRINSGNLHGTGCTLSSAIAGYTAQGFTLLAAIEKAGDFVSKAIKAGQNLRLGEGNGPLCHSFKSKNKNSLKQV